MNSKYDKKKKSNLTSLVIEIRGHCIERVRERRPEFRTRSDKAIIKMIEHEVRYSRLIGFDRWGHEIRVYQGKLYACKYTKQKYVVYTYMLSKDEMKRQSFIRL